MINIKNHDFIKKGIKSFTSYFDIKKTKKLLSEAKKSRNFNNIFLNKKDFKKNKKYVGVNPRPGRNLAEKLDTNFIFSNKRFQNEMKKVLGNQWRILGYKLVMGVPAKMIPDWIKKEIDNNPVANLGAYIKEKYRDLTYFRGIDFHQDIIDFPDKNSDFITVYIYLDTVTSNSSPLFVLKSSHLLGASVFPHKIKKIKKDLFRYSNDYEKNMTVKSYKLTGAAGSMFYWHSNLLHGTQPHINDKPRISFRILVEKNSTKKSNCLIDIVNKKIKGSLILSKTRHDLTQIGENKLKNNIINRSI
jgi:hypothetical protein